jgi:isoleucyl-tRNA synthetase
MKITDFRQVPNFPELEKETLQFWDRDRTFQKSIDQRSVDNSFSFYDGPPFATGLPHYGHLMQSIIKDLIPRYQTMKGKRVRRV